MTEPGQIEDVNSEEWPAPTAKAELKFRLRSCEASASAEGLPTLVSEVIRNVLLNVSILGVSGILLMGFHFNQVAIAFMIAMFYAGSIFFLTWKD